MLGFDENILRFLDEPYHEGFGGECDSHRVTEVCAPRLGVRDPRRCRMRFEKDGTVDENVEPRSCRD